MGFYSIFLTWCINLEYYKGGFNPIGYLENASITWSEITNDYPILGLLLPNDHTNAFLKAYERYQKWVSKRGKQMGENLSRSVKANVSYGFFEKCMLEILMRRILGFYAITGSEFINYSGLASRISKFTRKMSGESLIKRIVMEMDIWIQNRKLDPLISKVVCLASAKLSYMLYWEFRKISFDEVDLEETIKEFEEIIKPQVEDKVKP